MNIIDEANRIFNIEIEELKKVQNKIGKELEEAINLIMEMKGKLVVTGIGKSGIIGQKISATLASTGTQSIFMNSAEGLHGDLGMISDKDLVLAISNSGGSTEVLEIIPAIKKIGAKIIAMTGNKSSELAKKADVVLDIGVEKEACPINLAPTSSTTATLVMGDVLSAILIKLKKFKPENFALYHPGGSLGRKLLTKVEDIMIIGDRLPIASKNSDIDKILLELTQKRVGAVCIVDDKMNLQGIITEGDIRRALKNKKDFFEFKALDIMTKNPEDINGNKMAIDALELMEDRENQISVLPVTEKSKLVGLIRIHDLLKIG
ncbi:MAG: KpsF/GutQ family sugar-phosphate isomerase [Fusobacteriota bacterium]